MVPTQVDRAATPSYPPTAQPHAHTVTERAFIDARGDRIGMSCTCGRHINADTRDHATQFMTEVGCLTATPTTAAVA
jgi:hypothetical protein